MELSDVLHLKQQNINEILQDFSLGKLKESPFFVHCGMIQKGYINDI